MLCRDGLCRDGLYREGLYREGLCREWLCREWLGARVAIGALVAAVVFTRPPTLPPSPSLSLSLLSLLLLPLLSLLLLLLLSVPPVTGMPINVSPAKELLRSGGAAEERRFGMPPPGRAKPNARHTCG